MAIVKRTVERSTRTVPVRQSSAVSAAALLAPVAGRVPSIALAALPANYEHAKHALATCDRIDECKKWADKMKALASYAKQADDPSLHQLATRISARAIRRAGDLLQTFNKGVGAPKKNGGGPPTISQRQAAKAAGMSKDQEVTAVRVANVPAADFEAAVDGADPATLTQLAAMGTTAAPVEPAPPGFIQATRAIGTIREFARFCAEHPAAFVAGGVHSYEVCKVRGHLATVTAWLATFDRHLSEEAP